MPLSRGRLVKDGGEGYIYEAGENPNLFLKIYKETDLAGAPIVTPELQSKLKYMKDNPPDALVSKGVIAWPTDLLVNAHGGLLGFVMPKLDMDEHIQRVYSYRHPKLDPIEYASLPSTKSRISIAINLCSALHELHRRGYVFGDFNHHNIGVNYRTGQIYFVDCDSLHITDHEGNVLRTNVIMAGYLAPEIISHCNMERANGREYNLDKVALPTFTKESDLFCLAVHIFKLLFNGVDPFRGVKSEATGSTASPFVGNDAIERNAYVFREGNRPSAVFCPPAESLPPEVLSLFGKAFIDGRADPSLRPSAEAWYMTLHQYLVKDLVQCAFDEKHHHYKELLRCPYCAADDRHMAEQGGIDFSAEAEGERVIEDEGDPAVDPYAESEPYPMVGPYRAFEPYADAEGDLRSSRKHKLAVLCGAVACFLVILLISMGRTATPAPTPDPVAVMNLQEYEAQTAREVNMQEHEGHAARDDRQASTTSTQELVQVADVVGMSQRDATHILLNQGFPVNVEGVFSNTVAEGFVTSQLPSAGNLVVPNFTATIRVSRGHEPVVVRVADVATMTWREAIDALLDQGLLPEVREVYSDLAPEGFVLSTSPPAGQQVDLGRLVIVFVSKGEELVEVADVVGMTEYNATAVLQSRGFLVNVLEDFYDVAYYGDVIYQSPEAGDFVRPGATVTIVINTGGGCGLWICCVCCWEGWECCVCCYELGYCEGLYVAEAGCLCWH